MPKRFVRILRGLLAAFLILLAVTTGGVYWWAHRQGRVTAKFDFLSAGESIQFDADGIPTIRTTSWERALELQGFATASERLWQMDLLRRSASGRLTEWFGDHPSAVRWDFNRRKELWQETADQAVEDLPEAERSACDHFTKGVNRFVEQANWTWGLEYVLLASRPEPWKCRDTMLILMALVDDMSRSFEIDAAGVAWRKHLPKSWQEFLFPDGHPWATPLFGTRSAFSAIPEKDFLPDEPITNQDVGQENEMDSTFRGSNNWVWRNPQSLLLANDPHMSMTVPQTWFAVRFVVRETSKKNWAVGVSVPGIPGIILGRNQDIAWAFTNHREDVDDLLEETLSSDKKTYLASRDGKGTPIWKPVEETPFVIHPRGGKPVEGVARRTHRGPLLELDELPGKMVSHQWLGFKRHMLRLPVLKLISATHWDSFNEAIDALASPAQNVLYADKLGNMGIRLSGTGVVRNVTGMEVQPALVGEWKGLESPSQRPRRFYPASSSPSPMHIATANEQVRTYPFGAYYASGIRKHRIETVLSQKPDQNAESMQALQGDRTSEYLPLFLKMLTTHAKTTPQELKEAVERWKKWDGDATHDAKTFSEAVAAHNRWTSLLLGRLRRRLLPADLQKARYDWKNRNAWLLRLVESPNTHRALGLEIGEVATWVLGDGKWLAKVDLYSHENRWMAQHPLAGAVPLLGTWMRLDEAPQTGFEGLVRIERPKFGASTRLVWDLMHPERSTWGFPVGQSGHVGSQHYKDLRRRWFGDKGIAVFPKDWEY